MLSYEIIMYAALGTLWGLFIWDRLGMFRCDHLMCPCTIHHPISESDGDENDSQEEENEDEESNESEKEDKNDDIFNTGLTPKQTRFYQNQGVEFGTSDVECDEYCELNCQLHQDKRLIEEVRKSNIKKLTNQLAPLLEKHKTEPLELKELMHDVIQTMNLGEDTAKKVMDHFNEPKIKELQSILSNYAREIALTDDTILVHKLDELQQ